MTIWSALHGRVTLFPNIGSSQSISSALSLYSKIWMGDPESSQRPLNPLMPSNAVGRKGKIALGCSVHPSRVDFNLTAAVDPTRPPNEDLLTIEDSRALHDELCVIIRSIKDGIGIDHVSRIALAVQFVAPAKDFEEANRLLSKFMPKHYCPTLNSEEDLAFQVNRPKAVSEFSGLKLNLLTKWSVERFHIHRIELPQLSPNMPTVGQNFVPRTSVAETLVSSIAFDQNNAQLPNRSHSEPLILNSDMQFSILSEGLSDVEKTQRELNMDIEGF